MDRLVAASLAVALFAFPAASAAQTAAGKGKPEQKAASSEVIVVEAEGEAAANDVPEAKRRALDAARRRAVEQAVGAYVQSHTHVQDATILRDLVSTHSVGFVRNATVLSEEVDEDRNHPVARVRIRAEVLRAEIDKDAAAVAAIIAAREAKRIYVFLREEEVQEAGKNRAETSVSQSHGFEVAFRNKLRDDGFEVLDAKVADGKLKLDPVTQSLNTPRDASVLANTVGADVIVYGTVRIMKHAETSWGFEPVRITANLFVAAPDSTDALAEYTIEEISKIDRGAAFTHEVAAKAAEALRARLYEAWRKQQTGSQRIVLSVMGVKDFGVLTAFRTILENEVNGVQEITSVRLSKGRAEMDVAMVGDSTALAKDLNGKPFRGMTLSVTAMSPNTIEVTLEK